MEQNNKFGFGIIGVHAFESTTGLFTVVPSEIMQLKDGFYPFSFSQNMYSNFNPSMVINKHEHTSYEQFEKLVGQQCKGMGIAGLMTMPIWGFKETKSLF